MINQAMKWLLVMLLFPCPLLFAQEEDTFVIINTDMGKIKVRLFNDTPKHRDNFIKNVQDKIYDDLLFHRVIKQFVVQGGHIASKDTPLDSILGGEDLDYRIPAEIIYPKYYHKRGALCAARTSDDINPEKESSATQFYIVTGKFYTELELDKMEREENKVFTEEQRHSYMLEGGTPSLDGNYTVFGEVVSGQKVVDKLQLVTTNGHDRPLQDIRIKSMSISKNK